MESIKGHIKTARKSARASASESVVLPCDEERLSRIAASAYYKAEARGFAPGYELEDWLVAEIEEKS